MRHLSALALKYVMLTVVLAITLGLLGGASFGQVLMAALALTAVAYLAGDLIVLPAANNWVAVAADAAIAWVVLRFTLPEAAVGMALFWSVAAIAVGEYFFHAYLQRTVLRERA